MRKCVLISSVLVFLLAAQWLVAPNDVSALPLQGAYVFSGATPTEPSSWIGALFEDKGTFVQLTITSMLTNPSEFFSEVYFNLNPNLDPTKLSITQLSGNLPAAKNGIQTALNGFKAGGDGYYDILFQYDTCNSTKCDRLQGSDQSVFEITYSGNGSFSASSFDFLSVEGGGQGTEHFAAHIQGIPLPEGGTTSGWIGDLPTVPEPGTLLLLGSGLIGAGLLGRRFQKRP